MRAAILAVTAAAALGIGAPAVAQSSFTDEQRGDIEEIVMDYLLEHPEVIVQALQRYQQQEEEMASARQRDAIAIYREQLVNSPVSPWVGNPDASVTVVEFFDYNCSFCKRMLEPMEQLIASDADIRVVFKEFPILAPSSQTAARVALAADMQGLYAETHVALMAHDAPLTDELIFEIAASVGLDMDRLREDMGSQVITDELNANYALAQDIGVEGTPAFVVGDEFVGGAVGGPALQEIIEAQRRS